MHKNNKLNDWINMIFFNLKKFFLIGILLTSVFTVQADGIYRVFDTLGSITDIFFTRGGLSEKNNKKFEELAKKLGVENRKIKARNMGILMRFFGRYFSTLASPTNNRVYLNEDCLNEMTDGMKEFAMANALAKHRKHHELKSNIIYPIHYLVQFLITKFAEKAEYIDYENDNPIKQYLTYGIVPGKFSQIIDLSIWELIKSQIFQHFETEADIDAITIGEVKPQDGIKYMDYIYHPNSENWPLYAKIQSIFAQIKYIFYSLPVIQQHSSSMSFNDRVATLKSLQ